jgi:hypothetical protein
MINPETILAPELRNQLDSKPWAPTVGDLVVNTVAGMTFGAKIVEIHPQYGFRLRETGFGVTQPAAVWYADPAKCFPAA